MNNFIYCLKIVILQLYLIVQSYGETFNSDFFIGAVNPGVMERRLRLDSTIGKTPDIRIVNIGKEPLIMSSTYGWTFWDYHIQTIKPFESGSDETLNCGEVRGSTCLTPFAYNENQRRAVFYAVRGSDRTGRFSYSNPAITAETRLNFDVATLIRLFVNMELNKRIFDVIPIPEVKFALEVLMNLFFPPPDKESVWDEVKEKVRQEIKKAKFDIIEMLLESDIKPLREKIQDVCEVLGDKNGDPEQAKRIYLTLAQILIGYEMKFQFDTRDSPDNGEVNYHILPLFVSVVNMKLAYYGLGLAYKSKLGLSENDATYLQTKIKNIVTEAIKHATNTQNIAIDKIYDTNNPNDMFNDMMQVRSNIGVTALEYFDDWHRAADKLVNGSINLNNKMENNAIVYSEYFGRTTPKLYLQALVLFGNPPLTPPKLSTNNVARLESLEIYEGIPGYIGGIVLTFEGNNIYTLGSEQGNSRKLILGNNRIMKMEVGGDGQIEYMIFYLSNGTITKYGRGFSIHKKIFEFKDHYIASMVAHDDDVNLQGQFANIAVSYRLNPTNASGEIPSPIPDHLKSKTPIHHVWIIIIGFIFILLLALYFYITINPRWCSDRLINKMAPNHTYGTIDSN